MDEEDNCDVAILEKDSTEENAKEIKYYIINNL